jgi:hypothetical protein
VLPFFEEHKLLRVLTDRGSEFCGNPERHEYELYLAAEDIDHSRTKTKSPRAICDGVTPALKAARAAFNFPSVNHGIFFRCQTAPLKYSYMLGGMFASCASAMCLRTVSEYKKRSPQMRQCHWSRAKMYGRHSGLFGSSLGWGIFKS